MRLIGFYNYTVILTYFSLISAILGMIQASKEKFGLAIVCLVISGLCDAFDGAIARTKKDRTKDEKVYGIQIDSLCDAVSFGVFPAILCYLLGMDGIVGIIIVIAYCLCGVIRLGFFNVMEAKRQELEEGANKMYRGLPITSISIILPILYILKGLFTKSVFIGILHIVVAVTAFFFVLDVSVKKITIFKH